MDCARVMRGASSHGRRPLQPLGGGQAPAGGAIGARSCAEQQRACAGSRPSSSSSGARTFSTMAPPASAAAASAAGVGARGLGSRRHRGCRHATRPRSRRRWRWRGAGTSPASACRTRRRPDAAPSGQPVAHAGGSSSRGATCWRRGAVARVRSVTEVQVWPPGGAAGARPPAGMGAGGPWQDRPLRLLAPGAKARGRDP
jgi:hypothetical protein